MSAKLVFLRRTRQEIEIQGGEVYFDINGKNAGKLASVDAFVEVPAGRYQIRMYKSHNYGSMVGFADVIVDVKDGESALIRYTAPAVVSQPGHIMVSEYTPEAANSAAWEIERKISSDRAAAAQKEEQAKRGTRTAVKWIIIGAVATGVLIAISYIGYFSFLNSLF